MESFTLYLDGVLHLFYFLFLYISASQVVVRKSTYTLHLVSPSLTLQAKTICLSCLCVCVLCMSNGYVKYGFCYIIFLLYGIINQANIKNKFLTQQRVHVFHFLYSNIACKQSLCKPKKCLTNMMRESLLTYISFLPSISCERSYLAIG